MKKRPILIIGLIYFLLARDNLTAQNVVSGYVFDSLKQPISSVSVTYSPIGKPSILGFTQTNEQGFFQLTIKSMDDSVVIKINHLSYSGQSLAIKNLASTFNFVLQSKSTTLKEVIVKNPPIQKINDTILYNVKEFTSKQDKVIADVIKKLPGIEIENGQIRYQGKPIQQYLINGLNLLDERYQLANNNLPAEAVQSVQVIQNHQPIKILDSLVYSDRASLNLQLKKVTTTGSGKLALGAEPFLWDANLTPMLFNKTFQALTSLQSNNTGNNITADLFTSTVTPNSIFNAKPDVFLPKEDFLSVQGPSSPPFGQERWLNNHVGMLSSNVIGKLGSGTELKGNINYYNEHTNEVGVNRSKLFLPNQVIAVSEVINNSVNTDDLRTGFTVTKNVRKVYLKNELKAGLQWKRYNGNLVRNDTASIDQLKKFNGYNITNNFSSITFLGKQLINFNSTLNFFSDPQSLLVNPGQFDTILNYGNKSSGTYQDIMFKNFDIDNSVSLIKGLKRFSVAARIGYKYQLQQLESNIFMMTNSFQKPLDGIFRNEIRFRSHNFYWEALAQYRRTRFKAELVTPVRYRRMNYNKNNVLGKILFEPQLRLKYNLSAFLEMSSYSGLEFQYGGISQMYGGYILNTYNNLQRYDSSITQNKAWNNFLTLTYANPNKSIFGNTMISYNKQFRNYLFQDAVNSLGMRTVNILYSDNQWNSLSITGNIGKYISALKTTTKLSGRAGLMDYDRIINGTMSSIRQHDYSLGFNVNNSSLNFLNFSYDGTIRLITTNTSKNNLNKIITQVHQFNIGIIPVKNHYITWKTDYYYNNVQQNVKQFFINLEYRINLHGKINLECRVNNLLNNDIFTSIFTSSYSYVESSYRLRPRQFLIGTWFKF